MIVSSVTPATIDASLRLWLRADNWAGGAASWADRSGAGVEPTFAQANVANQPSLVSNGIGGNPHLAFAGNQYIKGTAAQLATTAVTYGAIFAGTDAAQSLIFGQWFNGVEWTLEWSATGKVQARVGAGVAAVSNAALNTGAAHVVIVRADTTSGVVTMNVDGVDQTTTGTMPGAIPATGTDANNFGAACTTTGAFSNQLSATNVAEGWVYNTNIGATKVGQLWTYARARAGL